MTDSRDIFVTGYPRSGNVWLARLLGSVLDSPVMGIHHASSIASEGEGRGGAYRVRQVHLRVSYEDCDTAVPNAWTFCVEAYNGERVIHMVRDPRDVAVSAMHYWEIKGLDKTLDCMEHGLHPLFGPWKGFVQGWLNMLDVPYQTLKYEDLHAGTPSALVRILMALGLPYSEGAITEAIEQQDIRKKRHDFYRGNQTHKFYGREVLLKHLRKGTVGEWREFFNKQQGERAERMWGDLLRYFGYEGNSDWWKELV